MYGRMFSAARDKFEPHYAGVSLLPTKGKQFSVALKGMPPLTLEQQAKLQENARKPRKDRDYPVMMEIAADDVINVIKNRTKEVVSPEPKPVRCYSCGAPCRKVVLSRGGTNGWGDDKSRTVFKYSEPTADRMKAAISESLAHIDDFVPVEQTIRDIVAGFRKGDWQPIETAPKDGTRFLVTIEGVDRSVLAFWNGEAFLTIDGHDWTGRNITHWHPLPKPFRKADEAQA